MWTVPASDYEIQSGDRIRVVLTLGALGPPLEWIQQALEFTNWAWVSGSYEGADLILELERAPLDPDSPEIIQAGAVAGWLVAALVGSVVTLLVVKDFKIWRDPEGGWHGEVTSSLTGLLTIVAILGGAFLFLTGGLKK